MPRNADRTHGAQFFNHRVNYAVPSVKAVIFLIAMLMGLKSSAAQDLRPYEPPGTRLPRQDINQSPAQTVRPPVNDAVYEQFRAEVQRMTPTTRKRLTEAVQLRLERAREAGRSEEVTHNERLLGILGSIR